MQPFTISQLQRYSGISVHTIRAWEKRYNALNPNRSSGNTRYYDGNQLRRLLNITSLMNEGFKISELCTFSDEKLFEMMGEKLDKNSIISDIDEFLVSQIVSAALEFDEMHFEKVFSRALISHGLESTYLKVIYPAMVKLGVLWTADKIAPAQEHFITNLIRQKLSTATDMLPVNNTSKNHWVLFLPENEFHEIGLLMANYLIRNAGFRCTYFGGNVPFDTLTEAVNILNPSSLLFFLVAKDDEVQDEELLSLMQTHLKNQKIYVASQANRMSINESNTNITILKSLNDLKEILKKQSDLQP
jgi:DNA-binding transcriptional MerR regulator